MVMVKRCRMVVDSRGRIAYLCRPCAKAQSTTPAPSGSRPERPRAASDARRTVRQGEHLRAVARGAARRAPRSRCGPQDSLPLAASAVAAGSTSPAVTAARSNRRTVERLHRRRRATTPSESPSRRSATSWFSSTLAVGRPSFTPRARARSSPALTRSRMMSRSSWAMAPMIVNIAWPSGSTYRAVLQGDEGHAQGAETVDGGDEMTSRTARTGRTATRGLRGTGRPRPHASDDRALAGAPWRPRSRGPRIPRRLPSRGEPRGRGGRRVGPRGPGRRCSTRA